MRVVLQYFDSCPHWQLAAHRLSEAIQRAGLNAIDVEHQRVETLDDARRVGFHGSPTILVNGRDAFASNEMAIGLACRMYTTEAGAEGAPSVAQFEALLREDRAMSVTEVVDSYAQAWNTADDDERRSLLERAWIDDGVYCDPTATVDGRDALVAHIAGFRDRFPGARIELRSGVDEHGANFRFAWAIIDAAGGTVMEGVDFGRLADDGRIASITGFFGPLE